MLETNNKNKNPFTVPENYFEGLTKDIMNGLPAKEEQMQTKKTVLWKKVLPWASVAAVVAAVAVSLNMINNSPSIMMANNDGDEKTSIAADKNLAYNEVEDYFLFMEDEVRMADYTDVILDEE